MTELKVWSLLTVKGGWVGDGEIIWLHDPLQRCLCYVFSMLFRGQFANYSNFICASIFQHTAYNGSFKNLFMCLRQPCLPRHCDMTYMAWNKSHYCNLVNFLKTGGYSWPTTEKVMISKKISMDGTWSMRMRDKKCRLLQGSRCRKGTNDVEVTEVLYLFT
jgi:hypothetical protein